MKARTLIHVSARISAYQRVYHERSDTLIHTLIRMIVPNVVPRPPALLKQNTFHYAYCTVYGVNTFH